MDITRGGDKESELHFLQSMMNTIKKLRESKGGKMLKVWSSIDALHRFCVNLIQCHSEPTSMVFADLPGDYMISPSVANLIWCNITRSFPTQLDQIA